MSNMSDVVDLLARTDRDFEYTQRRSQRTKVLLCIILGPLCALVLGFAVVMFIRLWQGEDPFQFWLPFLFSMSFALHSVKLYVSFDSDSRSPLFAPVAALRESIRAGDTAVAPIVTDAALSDPLAPTTNRIGPLRRPMKWSNSFLVFALIVLVVAVEGSDFTFYINGHYMTRYHYGDLAGGHLGLYLAPPAQHGSFTDFAIYPA